MNKEGRVPLLSNTNSVSQESSSILKEFKEMEHEFMILDSGSKRINLFKMPLWVNLNIVRKFDRDITMSYKPVFFYS